ncbi:MAG: hypothetical protein KY455_11325 [Euryarchaeota archaeon]|nr:hypothetical protein [Euryarchaeota archaeon]
MHRLGSDVKFEHACSRLTGQSPLDTLSAVANLNQLIVDHLVRENPHVTDGETLDYDLLRTLWRRHERIDPVD